MNNEGQKVILVCDDEDLMRQVAGSILERAGFAVLHAAGGEEAVLIYQRKSPEVDLVLMDLSMPEESGLDVFRRLKACDAKVRVLFSSGFQNDERLETALQEGALGFLQKPYTMDRMLRMVRKYV
ncbi:response regulator [Marispirochaeta aestuarii]|uniref:response regulator n=1 Tax=Marispirochaeta aestuarii TaxID=1963862 RepID=UPI002ABE63DD|nr:response regulator [Marispirochaeta aestuarii]